MANIKQQKKRNRQNEARRLRNRAVRGVTRSALKNARLAIETGAENQEALVAAAVKALDKAAQKGVIHKNNVARHKSRLMHIRDFIHPGLENIFLCHLSEHNNTPRKATEACEPEIEGTGIRLLALPRGTASPMFIL